MDRFIPLSIPNFIGNEKKYVLDALEEGWVSTGGKYIETFEANLASYLNVPLSVACQSGTSGLHLSLLLSDVGYGDEVIVPSLTFIAAVNPIKYLGAKPIFMDCDNNLTLDWKKVEEFCENNCEMISGVLINKKTNANIKAIIAVHVFGNICNMEELIRISRKYNLKLIEDATEALGTKILDGKLKGYFAGTIGDFGVFSFNGNKIITTGGGGAIVGKDINLLKKAKYLSTQAKDDELYCIHENIGFNYRMTNLQGALGVAQLECLESFIEIKKKNYESYNEKIKLIEGLDLLNFRNDIRPNYWFYSLLIDEKIYGLNRDAIIKKLGKKGIQTRPIWHLIHKQKPYLNCESYRIDKAEYYLENILNIPCSSNLKEEEIEFVVSSLKEIIIT